VESLRKLGASVAIDDFGSGFTSFRNLRDLPVNIIKLDGSFCQDFRNNSENEYIVRSLIDLAGKFKIKTVAEWVQQPEDAEALRSWGVDYLQGNLFGQASMDIPWVASETPIFALNNSIFEPAIPHVNSKPPEADTDLVEAISQEEVVFDLENENDRSNAAVVTTEIAHHRDVLEAQDALKLDSPAQTGFEPNSLLEFSEIDASITTLRQTLSELKNFFPDRAPSETQNAA
jgi:EAL domain